MTNQIVDGFGAWDDLGTVQPDFELWSTFPNETYSLSGLLRLNFDALEFDQRTYAYLRCVYETPNTKSFGQWLRIFPKFDTEFITYKHPVELGLLKVNPKRYFQMQKRHRGRRFNGNFKTNLWSINLHVCNEDLTDNDEQEQIISGFPSAYFLNLL